MIDRLLLTQYAITALSSAGNAAYFWRYRSPRRNRRVGAVVMALLSTAIAAESAYFGATAWLQRRTTPSFFDEPAHWGASLLLCLGSLAVTGLVLRRLLSREGWR